MNLGVSISGKIEPCGTAAVYEAVDIVAPLGSIQCACLPITNQRVPITDY